MIKQIIGGVITVAIGGTVYHISQADIANNLANNTGMSQQQAQDYVNNIPKDQLKSFSSIGQTLVADSQTVQNDAAQIDCNNYKYDWETPTLSCSDGKNQMYQISSGESTLGNCYVALDTNLGSAATAKINECIADIDALNYDYALPIVTAAIDSKTLQDINTANQYNKSVLQAALQSSQ